MTVRMLSTPSSSWPSSSSLPSGTRYSGGSSPTSDVADIDADAFISAGWLKLGLIGSTAARPNATVGRLFIDTDIDKMIVGDGSRWLDPATGNFV